jgi:hypothetical protein
MPDGSFAFEVANMPPDAETVRFNAVTWPEG